MLDVVLALDGIPDVVECFEIDEPLQSVPFCKTFDKSGPMFEYPTDEIVCHADIKNAVWTIGQNVNVPACHADTLQDVDGRDKPGHDEEVDDPLTPMRAEAAPLGFVV